MSGTFTPNGRVVAARQRRMCSRSRSGVIEPEPISPNPPASLTAAARRQPLHQIMPPATIGWRMPNRVVILFSIFRLFFG